ncbi:MAG: thiol reductase thioredoxin [Burkholderiales bacterium RIFOXYC2_FULL_59_8]|nr:MAG: thiol reductase thioredoxin [Burkholderiales bacterium RIFOXYC2_FULL_59_8]
MNADTGLLVVCLCAEWCHVCCDYQSSFAQVKAAIQADHPQAQFVWIDIEDEADLLYPLDVDDFPTLLIAVADAPRFFGPITPQPQTLERLVRSAAGDASAKVLADPVLHAAVARLRGRLQGFVGPL